MATRGRPLKLDKERMLNILLNYKDKITVDGHKIISKRDSIWITIARDLENTITPASLYTFVTCNRYGVRNILTDRVPTSSSPQINNNISQEETINSSASNNANASTVCDSFSSSNSISGMSIFTVTLPKEEFESLVINKTYRRQEKDRPSSKREYTILKPGMWQHVFSEKIWETTKIKCGFNFKRHKLIRNGESGYACGTCKCGSVIKCVIDNTDQLTTKIKCKFIEGEGRCGKRYLRNPIRQTVAQQLQGTSTMKYRVEMADNLIQTDNNVEPPHLYSTNVLNTAKYELKQKNYLDKNPVKTLETMQLGSLRNIIHNIGLNPFYVHYWSNYQLDVYRSYTLDETACIYVDATGSIIKRIKRSDNSKTRHIFLYNCVVNSSTSELFPVSQMLSESHHTNAINYWLMEWIRSGAPCPREAVCDYSRALLIALVRTFTCHSTLEEYANACKEESVPACYIRINVAHFIKKYANFLKDLRPRIKQFYLCMLGQLILCRNVRTAKDLLKGILIIARSETEGETIDNKKTKCEEIKIKFKNLLTNELPE